MHKTYSNEKIIFILAFPGVAMFLFAILAPIRSSFYYGFTNFSGLGKANFIGLQNYITMAKDTAFWYSLRNSLLLAIGSIAVRHPLAIMTAVLLDRMGRRVEGFFHCIYFLPNVISVMVIAYLWRFIYSPNLGLLNNIAKAFGFAGDTDWLGSGNAIWVVLVVLIWHGFSWGMLVYYTGIKNTDPGLYEAAAIDGANDSQMFLRITLPLMKPVIQVNVTLAIISALKQMETVYLLTNDGSGNETQSMANYLYKQAFNSFWYGYGNAISMIFVTICILSTQVLNRILRKEKEA